MQTAKQERKPIMTSLSGHRGGMASVSDEDNLSRRLIIMAKVKYSLPFLACPVGLCVACGSDKSCEWFLITRNEYLWPLLNA